MYDPPYGRKEAIEACSHPTVWMAHEMCANIVPETWVDEVENVSGEKEKVVFGVDGIVKDRWNLVCLISLSLWRNYSSSYSLSEMFPMYQEPAQSPRSSNSVHKGQMPESIPRVMRPKRKG